MFRNTIIHASCCSLTPNALSFINPLAPRSFFSVASLISHALSPPQTGHTLDHYSSLKCVSRRSSLLQLQLRLLQSLQRAGWDMLWVVDCLVICHLSYMKTVHSDMSSRWILQKHIRLCRRLRSAQRHFDLRQDILSRRCWR